MTLGPKVNFTSSCLKMSFYPLPWHCTLILKASPGSTNAILGNWWPQWGNKYEVKRNDNLNKKKELLKIFSAYTGKEYDGDYGDLFDGTEESTCSSPCLQTKVNSNGSRWLLLAWNYQYYSVCQSKCDICHTFFWRLLSPNVNKGCQSLPKVTQGIMKLHTLT